MPALGFRGTAGRGEPAQPAPFLEPPPEKHPPRPPRRLRGQRRSPKAPRPRNPPRPAAAAAARPRRAAGRAAAGGWAGPSAPPPRRDPAEFATGRPGFYTSRLPAAFMGCFLFFFLRSCLCLAPPSRDKRRPGGGSGGCLPACHSQEVWVLLTFSQGGEGRRMEEPRRPGPGRLPRPRAGLGPGDAGAAAGLARGAGFAFAPSSRWRTRVVVGNKTCGAGERQTCRLKRRLTLFWSQGSRLRRPFCSLQLSQSAAGIRQETAEKKKKVTVIRGPRGD